MVFYFVWPEPVLFEKSFIYSIFPNLEMEHAYLSSIGREEFANNFVNYQESMVFLRVIINLPLYIIFLPLFIMKGTVNKYMPWRMKLLPFTNCFIPVYMYLFGIWPIDRIGGHSRLSISGKSDYFMGVFNREAGIFNAGNIALLQKALYLFSATSGSGE